jgi:DNA-binding NtrC family response regulator
VTPTIPPVSPSGKSVSILAVSPLLDDHRVLRAIFSPSIWILRGVINVKDALRWLLRDPVPIVICTKDLPDGNWQTLLYAARRLPRPPRVLVAAISPDNQLWDDVGASGGFDVLALPFHEQDVLSTVRMAWESWQRQWADPPGVSRAGVAGPNPSAA